MPTLKVETRFDADRCRQYLNDELTVFHCHHYTTLFTQLADDAESLEGRKHLREAAAESMLAVLQRYCSSHNITAPADKIDIAQQYYAYVGLGKVRIDLAANSAEMEHSHVDEGWIQRWGKRDKPVNYIGQGFLAAAFALAHGEASSAFAVDETQSLVAGAATSKFSIHRN